MIENKEAKPIIDWENLTFSVIPTRSMYFAECEINGLWQPGELIPFGDIHLSPAAGVLNYGQGIFEGLKAFRTVKNRIVLFRPQRNAERFQDSAERLCIPPVPVDLFLEGVVATVLDNADYIPPVDKGSLYIRPCLWGTGPVLGVKPAPSYTFVIYVSPVGPYFKGGMKCLNLKVTNSFHRAAPKGTGNAKVIGNYAASLFPLKLAKEDGFDEVIYLNAGNENLVEEVGSANLFVLKGRVLRTPRLGGSILPGITRDSIIQLSRDKLDLEVEEADVTLDEVIDGDEVFCTGTAAVITPIGTITTDLESREIGNDVGSVTQELYNILTDIQKEVREDPDDWIYPVMES